MTTDTALVSMTSIAKSFGDATVLADVTLEVAAGEVHGLLGENGAGKSTLMKILAGVHKPDSGSIRIDGKERRSYTVQAASDQGIAMVYQELSLVPALTVAQNLALGREGHTMASRLHDRAAVSRAEELLDTFDTRIRPDTRVGDLRFAERQITEILKALYAQARVVVLDEPTASLTPREEEQLFAAVERLRQADVAIIYISHRLGEVLEVTDRITVLRNGQVVGAMDTADARVPMLVELMSGSTVDTKPSYRSRSQSFGEAVLQVHELSDRHKLRGVDLEVRAGEVVGLTGLVGAGRSTVLRQLFGLERSRSGSITLCGRSYSPKSPSAALSAGVALVPEDRREQGIFPGLSVQDNLTIGIAGDLRRWPALRGFGPMSRARQRSVAQSSMRSLKVRATGPGQAVGRLSGGNQQKVVFGKWLLREPDLLLLDEPTAGVDVSTKNEIWQTVRSLADGGAGVVYSSSDAEELAAVCDRVVVMSGGRVVGEVSGDEAADENAIRRVIQQPPSTVSSVPATESGAS